jgi:hypothetical protein
MTEYLIYFNQQWVGDHTEEWFRSRGPLAMEFLGGFAVVDVADDEAAKVWAGKAAEACGWPQEVRRFKPLPAGE